MGDDNIHISVLLSTFNDEKFIGFAVDSILRQSFKNFEFIIVNDGSSDSTIKIVKNFKDERIRLFDKPHTGLIDSLNFGISKCKYDWIARMDADDISCPDRLSRQIKYISEEVALIGTQVELIDYSGVNLGTSHFPLRHINILRALEKLKPSIAHPTVLINKSKLNLIGGYDYKMKVAEDFDLWLRLSKIGQLVNLNEAHLKLRKHSNNISILRLHEQYKNALIALKYHLNDMGSTHIDKFKFAQYEEMVGDLIILNNLFSYLDRILDDISESLIKGRRSKRLSILKKPRTAYWSIMRDRSLSNIIKAI